MVMFGAVSISGNAGEEAVLQDVWLRLALSGRCHRPRKASLAALLLVSLRALFRCHARDNSDKISHGFLR